jgi:acyl-CoA synthetase (AMP-forming)/AMP-acid ligase II
VLCAAESAWPGRSHDPTGPRLYVPPVIQRGPYPSVVIPDISLSDFVLRRAQALGSKPAFIDGVTGASITHAGVLEGVVRASSGLVRRGLQRGEVVATLTQNSILCPVAFHGVGRAGGIVSPLNPLLTADEAHNLLVECGARFLIAGAGCIEKATEAARGTSVEEILSFGDEAACKQADVMPFARLLADNGTAAMPSIDPREDVAALPFSSGTTGISKGVMLTHRNLVANVLQFDIGHMREDDVLVCVLPLSHIYGITAIQNIALALGTTTVLMPRFDLDVLIDVLVRRRVTYAPLVPPVLLEMVKNPRFADLQLPDVRILFSGAAPLSPALSEAVAQRFGCDVVQGYGMTESSPATHMTPPRPHASRHGSVGWPLADTEVRLVSTENGADVGACEPGEIWIRGPQVMKGYLNRPDATRATVDAGGWLHTGDIGKVDGDGHLFVVDRVKELIKYKAWQIAPAELEAVLLTHPLVADAAVIGMRDDECGEVPKAFVVVRPGACADEILAFVAARVAPYKKLRAIQLVEKIPKSPSGKILRRVLRDG